MLNLVPWLDRKLYPEFDNNWDDRMFREEIQSHLRKNSTILDYGAGRGNVEFMDFSGQCARVCGVDPDSAVLGNPYLDDAQVLDLASGRVPYADGNFDLIFSDNVMEHIDAPDVVLKELARVLKPGGLLLFKTPNKYHYMPLIARITPLWFHRFYNRLRGRSEVDTFPTRYRLNSRRDIEREAGAAGFAVRRIDIIEGRPEYLRMFSPTYLLGYLYERLVNSTDRLSAIRCVIFCSLVKPKEKK